MKKQKLYTYDVYYNGNPEYNFDCIIENFILYTLKTEFNITAEEFYTEISISNPTYRLLGFILERKLTNIERFQLTDMVIYNFQSMVKPQ